MPTSSQCLFIIDNAPEDQLFTNYFKQFGFTIVQEHSPAELYQHKEKPMALLINCQILLSNHAALKTLLEHFHAPILVISDTKNDEMSINMLENGADDFLIKPLNPREVHARITTINRRIQKTYKTQDNEKEILSFNNWHLYPASRQLFNDKNEELMLSTGEYNLLLTFLRHPQQILGRETLLQITKNSDLNVFDRRIDIQISRLRQKIEPNAKKPMLIKTIRNGGYIFTAGVLSLRGTPSL